MFGGGDIGNAFGMDQGKAMVSTRKLAAACLQPTLPPPPPLPATALLKPLPLLNFIGIFHSLPQEASCKEFLARPENAALVEAQQRKEAKQAVQLQEKVRALHFREKVRGCELPSATTTGAWGCQGMVAAGFMPRGPRGGTPGVRREAS